MVKNSGYSSNGRMHTFDDFYRNDLNLLKSRSSSNDLTSTNNSSSPSPTSPCSPNGNPYTFYNVFSDFKHSVAPDVVLEEDETEDDNDIIEHDLHSATPVFYLEEDHHSQIPVSPSSSSTSPNWPSLIFSRLRHSNNSHNPMMKQVSVNENQMSTTKTRKNDISDSVVNKHRFLKRSQTTNNTNTLTDKKCSTNDDFPELSFSPTNNMVKKHRSFASLFHYFHHNHHQNLSSKTSNKSNSIDTLHLDNFNTHNDISRPKLVKQKTLPSTVENYSPVNKSSSTLLLPKLTSFFQRHHLSEQHKDRVGNLKARLHHRRHSPPLTNNAPKFQCQVSNELIQEVKRSEDQEHHNHDCAPFQRSVKPVVMKRVHTWHNSFDLRPIDQCLEY